MYQLVKSLEIKNFKCFDKIQLSLDRKNILIGANGCGKTSIIDAFLTFNYFNFFSDVSFLDFNNLNSGKIYSEILLTLDKSIFLKSSMNLDKKLKIIEINDKKLKSRNEISNYINFISLKPLDQLEFIQKDSKRVTFERMLSILDIDYLLIKKKYNDLCKQRMKILSKNYNSSFLDKLEEEIVNCGSILNEKRLIFIKNLSEYEDEDFLFSFQNSDEILKILKQEAQSLLKTNRQIDSISKRMKNSFHRFDFDILYKKRSYNLSSSSEQKKCIFKLIQVSLFLFDKKKSPKPILLIDEFDSFFDKENLIKFMKDLNIFDYGQIILTSPNLQLEEIYSDFNIINLDNYKR